MQAVIVKKKKTHISIKSQDHKIIQIEKGLRSSVVQLPQHHLFGQCTIVLGCTQRETEVSVYDDFLLHSCHGPSPSHAEAVKENVDWKGTDDMEFHRAEQK